MRVLDCCSCCLRPAAQSSLRDHYLLESFWRKHVPAVLGRVDDLDRVNLAKSKRVSGWRCTQMSYCGNVRAARLLRRGRVQSEGTSSSVSHCSRSVAPGGSRGGGGGVGGYGGGRGICPSWTCDSERNPLSGADRQFVAKSALEVVRRSSVSILCQRTRCRVSVQDAARSFGGRTNHGSAR